MCPCVLDLLSIWILGMFFFFQGETNTGAPGENISEKGRENSNHISRPLRDLEHFKRGNCSNHWAHPGGRGNSKKFGIVVGRPKS